MKNQVSDLIDVTGVKVPGESYLYDNLCSRTEVEEVSRVYGVDLPPLLVFLEN